MAWAIPATAQRVPELGVQALVATSSPTLAVGGVYGAVRVSQRVRLALTVGAGVAEGDAAARGELLTHFLLNPTARRGAAAYLGGGMAGVTGPVDEGYVVLLIGLESGPGAGSGWALELGLGGGLRVAAAYRWRRHPRRLRCRKNEPAPRSCPGAGANARAS